MLTPTTVPTMPAPPPVRSLPPASKALADQLSSLMAAHVAWASAFDGPLASFESALMPRLFALGRLLVTLMAMARQERLAALSQAPLVCRVVRHVRTLVGVVQLVRLYFGGSTPGCPLDASLAMGADKCQFSLLSLAVRLACRTSFEEAHEILGWFVPEAPSIKAIRQAALGMGAHGQAFVEQQAAPQDDGEVLVLQFDSKAIPTATDSELQRRRRARAAKKKAASPRHRGRDRRAARSPRKRRRPGDKSKNGRITTMVVMYTLKRKNGLLLGPVNKKIFTLMGPKELIFQLARAEATKRGFGPDTRKVVQVVTDGDDDLAELTAKYFPKARHTIDVMHALEYVAEAGRALHRQGSKAFDRWFEQQRDRLYDGQVDELVAELQAALDGTARRGPGNKGKRKRLEDAVRYLGKRSQQMRYDVLAAADLELGSGAVEGAIKNVVVQRFDRGGMRWTREGAQALMWLRCIDRNGDWEAFATWVRERSAPKEGGKLVRLQRKEPAALPQLKAA